MSEKTGGPAFPVQDLGVHGHVGMTLRDYFAAHALGALPDHLKVLQADHRIKIAEWVGGLADAMLAERSEP